MNDGKVPRVMVVDDDKDILELLKYNFEKEGLAVAESFLPDLVILDIMMPKMNGLDLCRAMRKQFENIYIFFLTAKSDLQEAALEMGGDDFIEKTIGLRSLTCKVSSVLKNHFVIRKGVAEIAIGDLKIIRASKSVKVNKHEIMLSLPEFELLFFLAQNPKKSISTTNLLRNIWGSEVFMIDKSIEACIQSLTKKLGIKFTEPSAHKRYRLQTGLK